MNKPFLIIAGAILVAIAAAGAAFYAVSKPPAGPVACSMEAKLCPDGSTVGRTGPNCEFSACPGENNQGGVSQETLCQPDERNAGACIQIYNPVCALVQIQCIRAPCNPIRETFSNSCEACRNPLAKSYTKGACAIPAKESGTVEGSVTLSPTCPVERIPPDPACAPRPYATTIQVIKVGSPQGAPFATTKSDSKGKYSIILPAGDYALQPTGGNPLPRCETKEVTVKSTVVLNVDLSCDTGIR